MRITSIKTNKLSPREKGICGEFTLIFDNFLCVRKVLVINSSNGLFITFPNSGSTYADDGTKKYDDVVHPVNTEARNYIKEELIKHYKAELNKN